MKKRRLFRSGIFGLVVSLFLGVGGPQRPAAAQENAVRNWDQSDFVEAKSFICAWAKGSANDAIKAIKDQGFRIVDVQEGEWAVCQWDGQLDSNKLEALKKSDVIRYVEPNFGRYITPDSAQGNVQQTIEFKPVFTSDNVLPELKKTGRMICAWKKGKAKNAVKSVKDLGLKIVDVQEGEWIVCTWDGELTQQTVDKLSTDSSLLYIEPDEPRAISSPEVGETAIVQTTREEAQPQDSFALLPQDEFINQLYGMRNINAPLAWRNVQTSPVVVAVCDTGVDYTHEDLRDNMWQNPKKDAPDKFGADFIDIKVDVDGDLPKAIPGSDPKDRHYHGTHVAGIIGAVGNNKIGVCGVCWRVQVMAVRCLGADGHASASSVAKSIEYATRNGAKVINLSLGGRRGPLQTELNAMKEAREKGVIVVVAAGNVLNDDPQLDNDAQDLWPANYTKFVDNIVVVANTDINNQLNPGSHFGKTTVHLAAPGTAILSTLPMTRTEGMALEEEKAKKDGKTFTFPTKYGRLTGTSMSAPHVSGAIALLLGHPKYRSLAAKTPTEVKSVLFNATKQLGDLNGKVATGGLLDLSFLGEKATPPPDYPPPERRPPPVVICPNQPPCVIICPPPYQCPQYRCRVYCHRHRRW